MRTHHGFTLVEIAVVLIILGLLLVSALGTFRAQNDAGNVQNTRNRLSEAREALLTFAVSTGHLACPANPAATSATQGLEDRTTNTGLCNRSQGWLPWVTLGTRDTDAWGRHFTYRVDTQFADSNSAPPAPPSQEQTLGSGINTTCIPGSSAPAGVSFMLCSAGDITIQSAAAGGTLLIASASAIIISHGQYGPGSLEGGGSGDEAINASPSNTNPPVFISKARAENNGNVPDYDDLVEWVSVSALNSRMISVGKLP